MTIAVIIPVFNSSILLGDTLLALSLSTRSPDELIVVDDGCTDESPNIAKLFGARVVAMPNNQGPAASRNYAALLSQSDLLIFLDADTCVHPNTLQQMEAHLLADPTLTAVIGSYDDAPRDPSLCSQYRNLAHCYVHRSAKRAALTFWSGCGAIRRAAFLAADGFDERFSRPSVEDIELGYRLSDRGARILLDPGICVTHTKRWTVWNSVLTDLLDRGIPWMALLLERGDIPDDLNISLRHRIATALTAAALLCLAACGRSPLWLLPSLVLAALALTTDAGLLQFIYRKRGFALMPLAVFMTLLQNLCKLLAAAGGLLLFASRLHPSRRVERRSKILDRRRSQENESMTAFRTLN
jgi:GT2 family glycosyltransferase